MVNRVVLVGVPLYVIQRRKESSREKRITDTRGTEGRTPQIRRVREESRIRVSLRT